MWAAVTVTALAGAVNDTTADGDAEALAQVLGNDER